MRCNMADTFGSFRDNIFPPLRNWIVELLNLTIRIGCSGTFVGTISGAFFNSSTNLFISLIDLIITSFSRIKSSFVKIKHIFISLFDANCRHKTN